MSAFTEGFSSGFTLIDNAKRTNIADRQIGLEEKANEQAERARQIKTFTGNLKQMAADVRTLAEQALRNKRPDLLPGLADQFKKTMGTTARMVGVDPNIVFRIADAAIAVPSPEQVRQGKAADAGAVETAKQGAKPKFGEPQQIPGAPADTIGQRNQTTQQFDVISKPTAPLVALQQEAKQVQIIGETFGNTFKDNLQLAKDARSNKSRTARFRQLLTKVDTGATQPAKQFFKRIIKDLGVNLSSMGLKDDVGAAEAVTSLTVNFALDAVQRTKGAISDKEMALFVKSAPQLSSTEEGNELLLEMIDQISDRAIEIDAITRRFMQSNDGKLNLDFFDALEEFHEQNPLFTEDLLAEMDQATTQGTPIGTAATTQQQPAAPGNVIDFSSLPQ